MGESRVIKSETAQREEEILAFWNDNRIFEKSVEREPVTGKEYTFYDGPPFATGLPHYGHILASAIKDAIPRYWTMKGYRVKRQWGWDCHGLPIENIVEKELGTKSKKDIEKLGIKKFNDICRERIFTYISDWERIIPRLGRWADMVHPYRTMDKDFMESDWWAFKTLYDKGLIYEDYRSMHICPRCETTLSQSEVAEGYRDVKDLAVTVKFKMKDPTKHNFPENTYFLAWTTTPWTLPGNTALAVHKDVDYVLVEYFNTNPTFDRIKEGEDPSGGESRTEHYLLAVNREAEVFGEKKYKAVRTLKGDDVVGISYEPPFDYFINDTSLKNHENGWKVYHADFVTDDSGTGIAHEAPAFGEDDLKLSQINNLPFVQHVGLDGVFTKEVTDFPGLHVKPKDDEQATDVEVIKYLAHKGLLFAKEKYEHSYPHCWRCDTPLLNYATSSWFVAVTKLKPKLLEYAQGINWSPAHIKEGRWGQWLEGARDWSISRQRFWATTMPVWRCNSCKEERVFGSIAELAEASGVTVTDLHKDVVDEVTFPCSCGDTMRRIPDVLDTWFDSGSVPYSALHYPFENEDEFTKRLPVDFIAEGQDQTRTWFYYQHVLAGALFGSRAFNNVIVNGLVLAEDGKKMSKKLQNYPDPLLLVDQYGADAMRLYILSSPGVAADNLLFAEKGVDEWMKKVIMRLENTHALLSLYDDGSKDAHADSTNVLDRWIIARTHELVREATIGLDAYALNEASRPLLQYVDDLSTWYVRRSRERLKDMETNDGKDARATLRYVLRTVALVMAPFAPFMADSLWLRLRADSDAESVHLALWPELAAVDTALIADMTMARRIVSAALEKREQAGIKVRQPLASMTIGTDIPPLDMAYVDLMKDEVNVKEVRFLHDAKAPKKEGNATYAVLSVELDTTLTPELELEGRVRDVVRAVQGMRKDAGLNPSQKVTLMVSSSEAGRAVVAAAKADLARVANVTEISFETVEDGTPVSLGSETAEFSLHTN